MKISHIYSLNHPITGEARYIGQTIKLKKRLYSHVVDSRSGKHDTHVSRWIRKLLAQGLRPKQVLLHTCHIDEIDEMERCYIEYYRTFCDLTNILSGGQVKFKHTTEQLSKMKISSTKIRIIYCINIKTKEVKRYNSTVEIRDQLGLNMVKVKRCCDMTDGKQSVKTYKGYIFTWETEFLSNSVDDIIFSRQNTTHVPILKYDSNGDFVEEYKTMSAAASELGLGISHFFRYCHQIKKFLSHRGYQYRIKTDDSYPKKIQALDEFKLAKRGTPVIQMDIAGNEISPFASIKEAANKTASSAKCIRNCCIGEQITTNGYKWKYA